MYLPTQQSRHGGAAALIGDMQRFHIGAGEQKRGQHVLRSRRAGGRIGVFAGIGAQQSQQGARIRRREIRPRHEDIGRARKPRDRRQIAVNIIRRAMDQRAQADRPDGRGKQRMTIWRGFRDDIGADTSPRAGAIFRHNGLAQAFR